MAVNTTSIKTSSNGIWQGDNPLDYAFPLLIVQTILVIAVSRGLAFVFKPLHQPRVVAEMLGGILLGPSALGHNQQFLDRIFPIWSTPILESVSTIGLVFFLFLVGLELDLSSVRDSGLRAVAIGVSGIASTFLLGAGVAYVFHKVIDGADKVSFSHYMLFMGVALSITAFPVLARILAELKLLTTRVGETAMAAAALNDIAAWIFLALVIAIAGNGGKNNSALSSVWVLLSGVVFVAFMMVAVKPAMKLVGRRFSPEHTAADEAYICLALAGVLASGFITDLIGMHAIFGAFVFGLTIPKEGEFAGRLMERIEDFVSCLLLPLYFASSGLKTDVSKVNSVEQVGLLVLVITAACAGKIIGTFVVAVLCKIPARESLTLGVLMNTKGLVELIVLNIGKEKKVLNDEAFTILVLMAIFTTFLTTPTIMAISKPAGGKSAAAAKHDVKAALSSTISNELKVLACIHGPSNIPSLINLIELTCHTDKSSRLKLFIMHLAELTDRSSSVIKFRRWRQNGFPFISCLGGSNANLRSQVAVAFRAYGEVAHVNVQLAMAVSPLETMHDDICQVAVENSTAIIILPFHKRWIKNSNGEEEEESMGNGWRMVNQRVLMEAPCHVAVLVDRRHISRALEPETAIVQNVCIIFFGGPDDRAAVELGCRMAEQSATKVSIMRFKSAHTSPSTPYDKEQDQDQDVLAYFKMQTEDRSEISEKSYGDIAGELLTIGRSGVYDLIVVGKESWWSNIAAAPDHQVEHWELGEAGDLLVSSGRGITSSVLVVQSQAKGLLKVTQTERDEDETGIEHLSNVV